MRQNILNKALAVINKRRYEAESNATNNKIEAFKNKEYKALYQQYVSKMIDDAKNNVEDKKELNKLKKELDAVSKKYNLPDTEPKYTCKKCEDTGFIEGKYCSCLVSEINKILIKDSGFSKLEDFAKVSYDIFDDKETMKKLYNKMQEWCHSNFDKKIVYLAGNTGTGKTHLIRCMANELIKLNHVVLLTTSFAMNQDFLKSYACKNLEVKNEILDKYLSCDILFIDDLGTELRQDGITNNYLYLVLNERQERGKATVITSNMTLEDVRDYYDERISSRIINKAISILYYINGSDLRLKK